MPAFFATHQTNTVTDFPVIAGHFFPDALKMHGGHPTGTATFIDARNAFSVFDRKRILGHAVVHGSGIARYMHALDGVTPRLVAFITFIHSLSGVQRRDAAGFLLFGVAASAGQRKEECVLNANI